MNDSVICTIVAKNYLAYARCLTDSFLAQHPEGQVFVLLVDELDDGFDPAQERFTTILASEIGIPDFKQMTFRYTVLELSTAVKPFFLEYLFQHYDCRKVCYLDPDIYFYSRADEIFELLDSYGVILIPHLTGFLDDQFQPDELYILRAGAYNLGFIGLAEHSELGTFLHWWQQKLLKHCTVDVEKGLFVDQRWMDLAPSLFSSVYIHRDPGCNVAYWNLKHRPIERTGSGYTVNGSPLKFFHFSGFSSDNVWAISKHQNRYTLEDLKHLEPLFYDYRDSLLANGHEEMRGLRCAYDCFDNGVRIPEFARYLWREVDGDGQRWPDPFKTDGEDSFLSWLNELADDAPSHQPLITRLALEVHRWRLDLQQAFPDALGRDRWAFAEWFVRQAPIEHQIDDLFIKPMADSLEKARVAGPFANDYFDNDVRIPEFARYLWHEVDGDGQRWPDPLKTDGEDSFLSWLNESSDDAPPHQPLITRLALEVHRRRPDLQRAFRDVLGRDRWAFAEWFISQAPIEHHIDDIFIKPMADSLKKARKAGRRKVGLRRIQDWGKRFYNKVFP